MRNLLMAIFLLPIFSIIQIMNPERLNKCSPMFSIFSIFSFRLSLTSLLQQFYFFSLFLISAFIHQPHPIYCPYGRSIFLDKYFQFSERQNYTLVLINLQRTIIMEQPCQLKSQDPISSITPQQAESSTSPPKRAYKDRYKYRRAKSPAIPKQNQHRQIQPRVALKKPKEFILKRNWESRVPILIPNVLRSEQQKANWPASTHFCYNLQRPGLHFDYLSSERLA